MTTPTLVEYKGKMFSPVARDSLAELDRLTPTIPVRITQGGWNSGGVAASAGTHDRDAVDISTRGLTDEQITTLVILLRMLGWAAWYRPYNWDRRGGSAHIHAVPNRWGYLSRGAYDQTTQYRAGTNGLASHGPDNQLGATSRYRSTTWHDYLDAQKAKNTPAPATQEDLDMTPDQLKTALTEWAKSPAGKAAIQAAVATTPIGRDKLPSGQPHTLANNVQDTYWTTKHVARKLGVEK